MKVMVCTRGEAHKAKFNQPWAVISIKNPDMEDNTFSCPNLRQSLHLAFDDVDKVKEGMTAFCLDDARKVWEFVDNLPDDVEILLVHCLMGASRSPGIAAVIDRVLTGDDNKWFKLKTPNRRVYRAMLQVAMDQGRL